jgi:hypothetical protein
LGSNAQIMGRPVFAQEQIARAVELGLGASGPEQIELVTPDEQSRAHGDRIAAALSSG